MTTKRDKMIKRKAPASKGRRQHPESKGSPAPREADAIPLTRESLMDNPNVDAWMKEVSQSLEEVRHILEAIRMNQTRTFVRTAQVAQTRLDFRQPRRDGDSYQNAAYPNSPNQGVK